MTATVVFSGTEMAETKIAAIRARLKGEITRCCVVRDAQSGPAAAYAVRLAGFAAAAGITVVEMGYDQLEALLTEEAQSPVIFLQPAPPEVNVADWIARLGPLRDAEGLHPLNVGRCALGRGAILPPTAHAALAVARQIAGPLLGKKVAIVGASLVVGQPLAVLMMQEGATVRVAQHATLDLAAETRDADVVITAAGVPHLLGADHIRAGAVVIDVGVTRVGDDLLGDADHCALEGVAAVRTHVPDGVGPVTAAYLFENIANLQGSAP
ncbi:MAG: bifunctional 5,10-methylenetetrahydrofolate dehydrogenase/5,10-methenyltetrahydrofolate cyclohydrolase [Sulfitobacter sp.]